MIRENKIYVAGHKGLVGSALVRNLSANGYSNLLTVTKRELDLRRQYETEIYFEKERPDFVFLAAAKIGGILANDTYKAEFIYDNLMITSNIINSAYKYGVRKLLNFGSSCIYPKLSLQPIKEEYLLSGELEPTNEPHAIAKIAALKLCHFYNEQYRTNFISVMPSNLYGPNDNFNLETAHVMPTLIRKYHLARLLKEKRFEEIKIDFQKYSVGFGLDKEMTSDSEESIKAILKKIGIGCDYVEIWGSGEPFREFLYVDDLAEVCVDIMDKYDNNIIGEFVNIGTGREIKIRDLAKIVMEVVDYDGAMKFDSSRPDGTPRKTLDISGIKSLGWEPKISLRDGIKMTYRWYLSEIGLV